MRYQAQSGARARGHRRRLEGYSRAEALRTEARDTIDAAPGTCQPGPFAALQKRLGAAADKPDPAQQPAQDSEPKPEEGGSSRVRRQSRQKSPTH